MQFLRDFPLKHQIKHVVPFFALILCLAAASCADSSDSSYQFPPITWTTANLSSYKDLQPGGMYANSKNLKTVSFSMDIPKSEIIQCLEHPNLQNVEELNLTSYASLSKAGAGTASLTSSDLKNLLPRFHHLKILTLKDHGFVNDTVIEKLVSLPITDLNVSGCNGITNQGLEHIGKLKNLTNLDLRNLGQIKDTHLDHLTHLPIKTLAIGISENSGIPTQLTLGSLLLLRKIQHLEYLNLGWINISEVLLNQWKSSFAPTDFSNLTRLHIKSLEQITDQHLTFISNYLRDLTDLSLTEVSDGITYHALRTLLQSLPHLQRFEIDYYGNGSTKATITNRNVNDLLNDFPYLDRTLLFRGRPLKK